ncbi:hypothetical protein PR048_013245, partial [Dryococelus australis]
MDGTMKSCSFLHPFWQESLAPKDKNYNIWLPRRFMLWEKGILPRSLFVVRPRNHSERGTLTMIWLLSTYKRNT